MNSTQRWWFQGLGGLGFIFTTSSISSSQSYSLLLSSIYIGICTFCWHCRDGYWRCFRHCFHLCFNDCNCNCYCN